MSKLKAKIEERKTKLDRVAALEQITKTEKRDWTPEELTEFESLEGELRTINGEITVLQGQERAAALTAARSAGIPVQGQFSEGEERDISKYSLRKVMLAKAENRALDGLEQELHQEGVQERVSSGANVSSGYVIPDAVMSRLAAKLTKRAVTATGSSGAEGGHNIATEVNGYVAALRERSLMLQLGAKYLTGLVGNFQVPRENAVFTPGWKAETGAADASSPTFTKASFAPKDLRGYMDVSMQLLRQSSNDIEMLLVEQIVQGNAAALDFAGFQGPGTNSPTGILLDGDVAVTLIATDGGAITLAKLDEVDLALRGRKQYGPTAIVTTAKVRKVLRNLTLDAGSGLFVWDRRDDKIDGKPSFDTTHLPDNLVKGTSGAVCSALIEGVFSDAWYGQWGGVEILNDPYTQATSGMVRMVSNMFADFHVVRPASFQIIKDITTA
jgi:HK97 family phage major capsid protein